MASFTHPRRDLFACPKEDLVVLTDINRSLREQVVTLLLEVTILREQAQADGTRVLCLGRDAESARRD
jgi:hypothetical protein